MKTLVNSLNCRPAAWALALCVCTLFVAASTLAFSQISFEKIWEVDHPADYPMFPGFSKDGRFIYAGGNGGILQIDAANGQFIKYLDKGPYTNMGNTEYLNIMPDGKHAFTVNEKTGCYIWDLDLGKAIRFFSYADNRLYYASGITLSPDIKYLIYTIGDSIKPEDPPGSADCTFYIYDIEKNLVKDSMRLWGYHSLFSFSSDGKKLASVGYKNESQFQNGTDLHQKVFLWNTENWSYEIIDHLTIDNGARGHNGFELLFSPDNHYFSWFPYNRKDLRIYNIENKILTAKSNPLKDCSRIVFLPDSLSYGFCYPEMEIFDLKTNLQTGELDFPIYHWANFYPEKLFLGYGVTTGALYKIKSSGVNENIPDKFMIVEYQNGEIQIRFTQPFVVTIGISIINLNGKELYKSNMLETGSNFIRIPIDLPSGFYIVKIETSSKEYSTKLEVTR